jgi:hypothetical protein
VFFRGYFAHPVTKLKHWRGFRAKNGWNTAPVLEFAARVRCKLSQPFPAVCAKLLPQ